MSVNSYCHNVVTVNSKKTETYMQTYEYSWVKSRSKTWGGGPAVDTFKDLLGPDWYKKDSLIYVIDEKQLYRAKHKKVLKYIGKK